LSEEQGARSSEVRSKDKTRTAFPFCLHYSLLLVLHSIKQNKKALPEGKAALIKYHYH